MTIVIGIDPGITGALAFLDHNGLKTVEDMPVRPIDRGGKARNEVHPVELRAMLLRHVQADQMAVCVMETLNAFMGAGSKRLGSMASQASLAATKATIATVLELCGIETLFVSPQCWQKFYGIKSNEREDTKAQSLRIARELYGAAFCPLKKHHGRADSMLIARYGQRHFV